MSDLSEYPVLYRLDAQGRPRFWRVQVLGDRYRTEHGLVGGETVTSGWTVCTPKSRSTAGAQAEFEASALHTHKLTRRYHDSVEACAKPNFFAPMLARDYHDFAPKGRVRFPLFEQPKLDGMRCIATVDGLFSRQGRPVTACPHVSRSLEPLFREDPDLILDGELYSHEYRHDFEKIISVTRKVMDARKHSPAAVEAALARSAEVIRYHVYDAPSASGDFGVRHEAVARLFYGPLSGDPYVKQVTTTHCVSQDQLDFMRDQHVAAGYEGQMIRTLDAKSYDVGKRSPSLLKRKDFVDTEVTIRRIIEGSGSWSGYAKSVEYELDSGARLEDGDYPCAGIAGDQEFTARLLRDADSWVGKRCTVKFQKLSARGIPMFPIAVKFHSDAGERGRD